MFFGMAGYLFGHLMELILMDVSKYEYWIMIVFLITGAMIWLYRQFAHKVEEGDDHE
jgi:uncharacterized membrane protein